MDRISAKLYEIGVIPVIKLNDPEAHAAILAQTLCDGGIPAAEVTFRAAGAAEAIRRMKEACPQMLVGAGTVLSVAQAEDAARAGAEFIVMPGMDEEIVKWCQQKQIPVFPGCTTATDYHTAYRLGLEVLKFFPAEQSGGLKKIRALAGPFPMFQIMPTGGITLSNLGEYLADTRIHACGGTYMVREELIEGERWDEIKDLCQKSSEIVKGVR